MTPGGMRNEHVRQANLGADLRRAHAGPVTRSELAATTGLTRTAIASLVAELAEDGLVREQGGARRDGPGRPSPVVSPAPGVAALGVEISADTVAVALVALGGEVAHSERSAVVDTRPEAVADAVAELIRSVRRRARGLTVVGCGVAVAGLVGTEAGCVRVAPNLGWRDVPGSEMLRSRSRGLDPVVANEADLGLRAEVGRGAARGRSEVVYVSGEAGVGGGVLVRGAPLRGAGGYAGELGHLPVRPDGDRCRCGARGCWETEIGEAAVLRRAAGPRARRGPDALRAVLMRAATGERRAVEALAETGRWLGVGLAGMVNIFNPELIVLGGFFADAFDHLRPAALAELDRRALSAPRAGVTLAPARFGADAALIGAAELGFERLLTDPR